MNSNNQQVDEVITLSQVIKFLLEKKSLILKFIVVFVLIGIVSAFTSPIEYSTNVKLLPEVQEGFKANSSIGTIAGLAGIDVGGLSSSDGLSPFVYPEIIKSYPYLMELLDQKYYFNNANSELTIREYFKTHEKIALHKKAMRGIKNLIKWILGTSGDGAAQSVLGEVYVLTDDDYEVIQKLAGRISAKVDEELGIITVTIRMQDPNVVADVAAFTSNYIKQFVIDHQIQKAEKDLAFIVEQLSTADSTFKYHQQRLVEFKDTNLGLSTSSALSELEFRQTQRDLSFNIFSTLAEKMELAKIKRQEVAPVFTTLNPPLVANEKYTPKRLMILVIFTMTGLIIGVVFIFLRSWVLEFKNKIL